MSKITVGIGRTINTGNYESLRLYIEIEEDCPNPDIFTGDFEATRDKAKKFLAQLEQENGVA